MFQRPTSKVHGQGEGESQGPKVKVSRPTLKKRAEIQLPVGISYDAQNVPQLFFP